LLSWLCCACGQEELKEKYEDKLEKNMVGPMHHLLAKTFKVLSGKKVSEEGRGRPWAWQGVVTH
jgi:hypothetical protein